MISRIIMKVTPQVVCNVRFGGSSRDLPPKSTSEMRDAEVNPEMVPKIILETIIKIELPGFRSSRLHRVKKEAY